MSPAEPKPPGTRILFLPDGGPGVGGGHVMRCLALAEALTAGGGACAMLTSPAVAQVLDPFAPQGLERLATADLPPPALAEAAREAARRWRADIVFIDHYRLAAVEEQGLAMGELAVAVIDDLADRPHRCRLLVDPTLGREAAAYAPLTPPGCRILTGPAYALLSPRYARARPGALAARRPADAPRRLLLSLGLTDLGGITARALELIRPRLGGMEVDVVVGSAAPSLPKLRRLSAEHPHIHLHVDSRDMPALIAAADIAVGAGGVSTWERAALGLPSISLVLADNQRALAGELDRRGAVLAVEAGAEGLSFTLPEAFAGLLDDGELRTRLSESAAALCDGEGAARVAEAVLALG